MPVHDGIPRRTAADTTGEVQRVLGKLEATGQDVTILRLLANAEPEFRPFVLLSDALLNRAALPGDVREVVILWMAQERGVSYEWLEHVPMALRTGLTRDQVDALERRGVDERLFSQDQLLGVEVARCVLAERALHPELWQRIVERWGLAGAFDLLLSVGWWGAFVPLIIGALGLERPDG